MSEIVLPVDEVQALLDDLAPACESLCWEHVAGVYRPCRFVAEWLVWTYCSLNDEATRVATLCAGCLNRDLAGETDHARCESDPPGYLIVTHVERIRSKSNS